MTKQEFEMYTAAKILATIAGKDGMTHKTLVAQDLAQELADAFDRRHFFDGQETPARYNRPKGQQQQQQQMMPVVVTPDQL